MNNDFMLALDELCKEKNLDKATILDALQKALIKSYQKNYDNEENVDVIIDEETGQIEVFALKEVVDEVDDTITEISLKDALEENSSYHLGDIARIKLTPKNFGRVAAQTARNIVIQKIRDAQRDSLYGEYIERANEMITGTVQRQDKYNVYVNLDKIEGVVPIKEQVPTEEYPANAKMKFLIKEVRNSSKEPQIVLSRSSQDLITRLFELEVPEITDGIIEIYSLAREAGSRTKMAVFSNDEGIDAVGACIGFKGIRVNSIVEELQGEKIDIINFDKDIKVFISNALSPADIIEVLVNEKSKKSLVVVASDQLSLAIGKEGQNARLAARLTGWKIDIKSSEEYESLSQEEIDEILGLNEVDEEVREVSDEEATFNDENISLDPVEENDDTEEDFEVEEIIKEESDDTVEEITNIDSTVEASEEDESNED
ncbi:MAG: transcription termination factor NusA [Anaerococcus sp.]|uniref:transcription termination factor NusA n=1 Tax=Anaerococcus sp. TaxID=1872515 RepID=UPI002632897E|nr:transcription termination factor NusA [Anaerococcus sp.]MCI5972088.1 transcription termination factor NusA [Anaerococcus sp.]MDD6918186.1 transcription termination factor NusA [Peptoniphilaceae bacterium]MDY2928456.1 transcription termination factor NusA [Anaerococcus sp.]